jgi:GT2 family glycosyltransferase
VNRVAAFVVNYNMPEKTDALCEHISANVKSPIDVIVIDNGSDLQPPSKYTALRLDENVQTTNGWLMGLHYADALAQKRGTPYFAYWFIITSAEFLPCSGDPLAPLLKLLHLYSDSVGVHPALSDDSTTSWTHLKTIGMPGGYRRVFMIDNIASLYRADWFDSIGRFDPTLTYAWGIDLETCWKARRDNKTIWVSEPATVRKVTNIGYTMNRMNMTASDREQKAGNQMREVLSARYGGDWWNRMNTEFVDAKK